MAGEAKNYRDVIGVAVKVTRPDANDKTKVTLKSLITGSFVSVTIWDNSHPEEAQRVKQGDLVFVTGDVKQNTGTDGTTYNNLSAFRLFVGSVTLPPPRDDSAPTAAAATVDPADLPTVM